MAQLFVPSELAGAGPGSGFYLAAVIDANGHLAIGYTPYWQTAAGILVPAPIDATTNSLGTHDDANGAPGGATPATALQVGGSDGTDLRALATDAQGHVLPATARSTTEVSFTALAASATYTQGWVDAQAFGTGYVAGSVLSDQAGTLYVDFSDDASHVAQTVTALAFTPTTAGTANAQALPRVLPVATRYYRFRYVNGATAQTTFGLYQTPLANWTPGPTNGSVDVVPLTKLSTQAANTTFAQFTAPSAGQALLYLALSTSSIVNQMVAVSGTTTLASVGAINGDVAIGASQPQTFTFGVSRGATYGLQLAAAQTGDLWVSVGVGPV